MKSIALFVSLVVLLLANPFEASAGASKVNWDSSQIAVAAFPGTAQRIEAAFVPAQDVSNASVWITPGLARYLQPAEVAIGSARAGTEVAITFYLKIPAGTGIGDYEGTIHIRTAAATVARPKHVRISVAAPNAYTVPTVPATPSPDRLTADPAFPGQYFVSDEVLLQFGDNVSEAAKAAKIAAIDGVFLGSYPELGVVQVQLPRATDLGSVLESLRSDPDINFAVPHEFAPWQKTSNDPVWSTPFYESPARDWGQRRINLPEAWDIEVGRDDVKVAIVDSGFEAPHEDLQGNFTYVDSTNNGLGCVDHGTKVAGIVGAEPNNRKGLAGVMWAGDIELYEVGEWAWLGLGCAVADLPEVASLMSQAARNGARVINLSIGALYADSTAAMKASTILFESVVRRATDTVFVFAAGNDAVNVNRVAPANLAAKYVNVLAVAATQENGRLAKFTVGGSNFGSGISVAAPGSGIWTSASTIAFNYERSDGTSFAAPFVAGLAGLLFSYDSTLSAAKVAELIVQGAREGGAIVPGQGFYVINAQSSLLLARPSEGSKVTFVATGRVTSITNSLGRLDAILRAPVAVGDPVSVRVSFRADAPDAYPDIPSLGIYAADSIQIKLGSNDPIEKSFGPSANVRVQVMAGNGYPYGYVFQGYDVVCTGCEAQQINLQLLDGTSLSVPSDAIPTTPPSLSGFRFNEMFFDLIGGAQYFSSISATVDTLTAQ